MNVQQKVEEEKISSLKKAVARLQEDLNTQKMISKTLSEENQKLKHELEALKESQSELEGKVDTMTTLFQSNFTDLTIASVEKIIDVLKRSQKEEINPKNST